MKNVQLRNSFLLLLTAFIWGTSFVAQSVGTDYVQPFTFNGIRSLIGSLVLLPCIAFLDRKTSSPPKSPKNSKDLILGGTLCGILLFAAANFQQFGIQYTTVGKTGFITACYIVIIPIFGLFLKKKCTPFIWLSVLLALVGLYFLCITTDSLSINFGDFLVFICAILFSFHILVIDHFSPLTNGIKLSCIQFFVCGTLSIICMFLFEQPDISLILSAWAPLMYAGVLSCGVAYTLQIVGQKDMNPTVAALILSLESCISVLAGWILLGEALSHREIWGCILMFTAIILAQLPVKPSSVDN